MHIVGEDSNVFDTRSRIAEVNRDDTRILRIHCNVEDFGNTAAAGSPSVVSERWQEWRTGDDVAVVGVGSGLTWGGFMIRFGVDG